MYIIYKNRKLRRKKVWKYRNIGKIQKLQVTESKNYSGYTIQKNRNYKLRSQILGSFEITKTNEVNRHDFFTDSFLK